MAEFLKNCSSYLFMNFLFRGLIQATIINGELLVEPRIFTYQAKNGTILLKNIKVRLNTKLISLFTEICLIHVK